MDTFDEMFETSHKKIKRLEINFKDCTVEEIEYDFNEEVDSGLEDSFDDDDE